MASEINFIRPGEIRTYLPTGALMWIDGVLHQGFQDVERFGMFWQPVPSTTTGALARHDTAGQEIAKEAEGST